MASSAVKIIGIYGISGCGKSYLLNQLDSRLEPGHYTYHDGSKAISAVVPGGLSVFHSLTGAEKANCRQQAINNIRNECHTTGKSAIIAGHFMFWSKYDDDGEVVCTPADLRTYTHIIYMDTPISTVISRRDNDATRARPSCSSSHLAKWQETEKTQLRSLCLENGILFTSLVDPSAETIARLISSFTEVDDEINMRIARKKLDQILENTSSVKRGREKPVKSLLFIDGDRTLAPVDTGALFWKVRSEQHHSAVPGSEVLECPLKGVFSSTMGYSFDAFHQAALLYKDVVHNEGLGKFQSYCTQVSSKVTLYSEFIWLLHSVLQNETLVPIVLTCGLAHIWTDLLARDFGHRAVDVIGCEVQIVSQDFVVTPKVKADLVKYARDTHGSQVWAFGDSVLDLPMMINADYAVVVVGREHERSKRMETEVRKAIDEHGLQAVQVLLPENEPIKPRLDISRLPIVRLGDLKFGPSLPGSSSSDKSKRVLHATARPAAKLLMTPTRDANIAGPALREAHQQVGRYLATEFVSQIVDLETYTISHVQNRDTEGYRLRSEARTIIVPLMRGGEPMALGVNDVFPLAMFLHAKDPDDLKKHHVEGRETVILADSVVNSGKSVVEFVERIRGPLSSNVSIVVVAGVVQADAVHDGGLLAESMEQDRSLSLVALRMSENKYTGRGGTDTGNRLFNTTHLD